VLREGSGLCSVYTRVSVGLRASSWRSAAECSPVFIGQIRRLPALFLLAVLVGGMGLNSFGRSPNKACGGYEVKRLRWLSPSVDRGGEGRRAAVFLQLTRSQASAALAPAHASRVVFPSSQIFGRFPGGRMPVILRRSGGLFCV
jgi:hypothetical protein